MLSQIKGPCREPRATRRRMNVSAMIPWELLRWGELHWSERTRYVSSATHPATLLALFLLDFPRHHRHRHCLHSHLAARDLALRSAKPGNLAGIGLAPADSLVQHDLAV